MARQGDEHAGSMVRDKLNLRREALRRRLRSLRRDAAGAVVHWSGAGRAFEAAARPTGAVVLMYHSVAHDEAAPFIEPRIRLSPAMFDRQMAFLSRHRRVLPLSSVVEEIAAGGSPPAGTVCITFDDGYRDNLTVAAPILEQYGLSATLYLATGYVERGEAQWADRLHWMFGSRTADRLSFPDAGLPLADLARPASRAAALAQLHSHLLESEREERARVLGEVERQLAPYGTPPRLTLNWDEVRELARRYPRFELGGHTRDHVDLRTHTGAAARVQIEGCAEDLRRELGAGPRHFSYPYERWCAETRAAVVESGWTSAVGTGEGLRVVAATDRFAIPRVESPHSMTGLRFKTSGAYPGALSMLGLM